MADGLLSTPRSTAARAAATTPHRRSQLELFDLLNSLFDSLETGTSTSSRPTSPLLADGSLGSESPTDPTAPRTAPLRLVPNLLDAFEQKRGVQVLADEDRAQLRGMVEGLPPGMENQPVGVEDVLRLLVGLGVTGTGSEAAGSETMQTPPRPVDPVIAGGPGLPGKAPTTTPSGTPLASTSSAMLRPDSSSYSTRDGSPVSRHRRTGSSSSSSARTSMTASPIPGSNASSSSSSRVPVPISRRRTIPRSAVPASMVGAATDQRRTSVGGLRTLKSRRTQEDLARLAASKSERTYLGVPLDRLSGPELDEQALLLAKQARAVMTSKSPTRERELLALLTPLQPAQLEALDRAYTVPSNDSKQRGKMLSEAVSADRAIKGTGELAVLGLLKGPLAWDADLVQKALDAPTINDDLLLELLINRSPAELALLRTAFAERQTTEPSVSSSTRIPSLHSSTSSATASPAGRSSTRSLDVAILSAFSSNTRLRKAWDIALKGKWEDIPSLSGSVGEEEDVTQREATPLGDEQARREKLLVEDLDQLKVALRRGGSTEIVARILLARSPVHLRKLCDEFSATTGGHSTLTRAIKQSVPSGPLQRLFLHAVSIVKHVSDVIDYGVWRDAKTVARLLESEKGPKRDELVTRLIRYRWDRSRFEQIKGAFAEKYKTSLVERAAAALSANGLAEIVSLLLDSPPPSLSSARGASLTADAPLAGRARSDASAIDPVHAPDGDSAELEADGELSDPPSPRSPPLADHSTSCAEDSLLEEEEEANASVADLRRSTSSMSSRSDLERPGSALSSHSRASGNGGHRPASSASGSADTSRLSSSLRHSRPMAPSRAKRRQSEEAARSQRSASEEPLSPRHELVTSPTFSQTSRDDLSRSTSTAISDMSLSGSQGPSSAAGESAIDTLSFFATPLSPIRDESRPSSIFFPDDHPSTPPPAAIPPFDASSLGAADPFTHPSSTPDSPERFFSSLMRRDASQPSSAGGSGSRPSSLFGDGMLDSFLGSPQGHTRDGSATIRGNEQFQQLLHHAQDLARKLKDNEARFHENASQYESEVSDLEGQLEEARSELHSKRREEKELRNAEQEHVQQISLLEGEVTKLNKSLDRSREAYETMKRNYTSTCDEADRLRSLVADLRRDNRSSEEAIRGHALQMQQFERDREMLQQAIDKLETELTAARLAQDALDDQKQENLLLKETIDKLRFEIEEMRSVGPRSGFIDHGTGSLSPSKSLAESISKSIGREIATRIAAGDDAGSDDDDDDNDATEVEENASDDLDDIIVTTHRRIRKRGKRSSQLSEPQVRLTSTVEMSDADCQTAAPKHVSVGSQTALTAVRSDLVKLEDVAPPPYPPARPSEEIQRDLAAQLGVDISLVKQLSEAQRAGAQLTVESNPTELLSAPVSVPSRRRSRLAPLPMAKAPAYLVNVFPTSARPYVAQLLDSGLSLVLYTATIYLVGVLSGSRFLPLQHRHYFSPVDLGFSAYDGPRWEGFASGAGADGGFAPEGFAGILYEALCSGVRTARRVPT